MHFIFGASIEKIWIKKGDVGLSKGSASGPKAYSCEQSVASCSVLNVEALNAFASVLQRAIKIRRGMKGKCRSGHA